MFSEVSAEMSSVEEFPEVLDLSQTDTDTSQCSTVSETDTYHEQLSPDLFPSDEEDLPIPCIFKHTDTFHSSTNVEQNNNAGQPIVLTLARRKLLATLAITRQSTPDITLYEDIIHTGTDQVFSLCTMTSLDQCKSAVGSYKLSNLTSSMENLGHSRSRLNSVNHSEQNQVETEQDLSVTPLAQVDLQPGPSLNVNVGVNAKVETTEPTDVDCLAILTDLLRVASAPPAPVLACDQETSLNAKPTSPETVNTDTDEHLELAVKAIAENDYRSFLVDNIDIYRNIQRCPLGKYHLHEVPLQHVIITGVITSKSVTRKSITQLEVDDGTAVVNCLFDDRLCLPEDRNNFHKHLDSWQHDVKLFRTDAVFDETFHFMREYAKRLFQETPQSDDLNLGDEVTIVGKVYDSKNEGRVIYHKYLWRKVDLASRENCDFRQDQFAKHGRHF